MALTVLAFTSVEALEPEQLKALRTKINGLTQRFQLESASFDRAYVDAQQVGGATPVRLWEWQDATMTDAPGSPAIEIGASAGWAVRTGRADVLAGTNAQLRFHLDSDTSFNYGGLAIDDVSVQGCVTRPVFIPRVLR